MGDSEQLNILQIFGIFLLENANFLKHTINSALVHVHVDHTALQNYTLTRNLIGFHFCNFPKLSGGFNPLMPIVYDT